MSCQLLRKELFPTAVSEKTGADQQWGGIAKQEIKWFVSHVLPLNKKWREKRNSTDFHNRYSDFLNKLLLNKKERLEV